MTSALKVLLFCSVFAAVPLLVGCGDDDDADGGSSGDPCAEQLQIEKDAVTAYCADKAAVCCFCLCWQDYQIFNNYDSTQFATDGTCICVEPDPVTPPACEDITLDMAENCVADPAACGQAAADSAQFYCDATPLQE
jgi:hypothetical protein